MNGLKIKALSIGLGGIAAAVLGGQAYAGVCPASAPVMTVTAPGFSCTLGFETFHSFTITGAPSLAVVEFASISATADAVTLSRDGGTFAPGTVVFDYTLTESAPHVIVEGTVGIDVATVTPAVVTTTTMNGIALLPTPLLNSQTGHIMFSPGATNVNTANSSLVFAGDFMSSITNTYSETPEVVPEPASLSLFGLGLVGLGLARRRRRS